MKTMGILFFQNKLPKNGHLHKGDSMVDYGIIDLLSNFRLMYNSIF